MTRLPALEILWADDDYAAAFKPAGLAVIPGRAEATSLLEELAGQLRLPHSGGDDPRLRVVHRIDKETSGVVVFAKHLDAQRRLSHQFQNNLVEKEYLALVAGQPPDDQGEIDAPLAVHPTSPKKMSVSRYGRPARTQWKVEARYRALALLRVFPRTGKTHQIRVHLRSIGLPLAIDPLYNPTRGGARTGLLLSSFKRGYRSKGGDEKPLIDRLTLHAERLKFSRMNGESVEVVAPLPKDFRATINMLAKYASA